MRLSRLTCLSTPRPVKDGHKTKVMAPPVSKQLVCRHTPEAAKEIETSTGTTPSENSKEGHNVENKSLDKRPRWGDGDDEEVANVTKHARPDEAGAEAIIEIDMEAADRAASAMEKMDPDLDWSYLNEAVYDDGADDFGTLMLKANMPAPAFHQHITNISKKIVEIAEKENVKIATHPVSTG